MLSLIKVETKSKYKQTIVRTPLSSRQRKDTDSIFEFNAAICIAE